MKKLYALVAVACGMAFSTHAQTPLPNGDLEDVTTVTRTFPNGVDTFTYDSLAAPWVSGNEVKKFINLLPDPGPFFEDTSWAYSGSHAGLMRTRIITGIVATGNAGIGEFVYNAANPFESVRQGTPFTDRPSNFVGHYAYFPVAGDSCLIALTLHKWNSTLNQRDTIGTAIFVTDQTVSSYTGFDLPLNYVSSDDPDSLSLIMLSSKGGFGEVPPVGQAGTFLVVDSLGLIYNSSGIAEHDLNLTMSSTENTLSINGDIEDGTEISVINLAGKLVAKEAIKNGSLQLPLRKENQVLLINFSVKGEIISEKVLH